ncbi:DNA-3-methyladenine glycosylase family protein [Thermodesulfobacteriota bacterium]
MSSAEQRSSDRICRLDLPNPFSVPWTTAHIRASSYGVSYTFISETRFRRQMGVAGRMRLVEFALKPLADAGNLTAAALDARASGNLHSKASRKIKTELTEMSRFIFGLDDDLKSCYAALRSTNRISRLVKRYRGLRIVKTPSIYESLLITILGQQVSVAAAHSIRLRLMESLGDTIVYNGVKYLGMPPPKRLADTGEARLKDLGVSRQKARYLIEMSQRVADGRLNRKSLLSASCEEAMEKLIEIPGVGRWTAEIVAMRGLGFPDLFPAGDLGLQVAAQKVFEMGHRPSEKELRDIAGQWEGWRSYAAFYLWMTLMESGYA